MVTEQELEGIKNLLETKQRVVAKLLPFANKYWRTLLETRELREQYARVERELSTVQVKKVITKSTKSAKKKDAEAELLDLIACLDGDAIEKLKEALG